ncbi:PIN domain-containing protein [Pseudonocardia halophobica]|uniref:PIN domain-containing protein n=1 Tax=Pseudonocardia halophobica TaxID=29401 RepID=UPI003D9495A8
MDPLILLDTSVLVDLLRGHEGCRTALDRAYDEGAQLAAATLTKVELLRGMRSPEKAALRGLLDALLLVPLDDAVAERAGAYARRYRASHRGVDVPDFIVAATAAHLDASLWTRNVKHFPMFEGLTAPY